MNSRPDRIAALRRAAETAAADHALRASRIAHRQAWAAQAVRDLAAAQDRVTQAWDRALDALDEDADEDAGDALPDPPEQAEVDRLHAEIDAVRTRDLWPRHLYWGDV